MIMACISNEINGNEIKTEIENYINQADAKFILVIDVALEKIINIKINYFLMILYFSNFY